ncbi:MAG TPA: hypothetical protein VMD97_10115 [Candidatus Aquilonibacter sp.]|nr:hypothetical protein [Candidatus Aquilonibacter sp.]
MKTTFVRAAVMTLAFVGLAVPSMTSAKTTAPTKAVSTTTAWAGYPTPVCPPSSGSVCGMQ